MALQEELEVQGNFLFRFRGTLPLLILVAGIGFFAYEASLASPSVDFLNADTDEFIYLGVCFLGLLIRILSVGYSAKATSGRNTTKQLADELNSTGIYSLVRHPLYVGNFLMWLGIGLVTENIAFIIVFVLMYWIYYERIMYAEEQFLRRKFGDIYLKWAENTPAFIPKLSGWKTPKYSFSWRKVLRREKNGVLAIFLIFLVFDILARYIQQSVISVEYNIWFYGFIASLGAYILIKVLWKFTKVLHEDRKLQTN